MIVVEGPDGSGKTTLANKICKEMSLEYRRPPEGVLSSTDGPYPAIVEWWRGELRRPASERAKGVYDRSFWISEPVYQSLGRRSLCTTDEIWRGIADLWAEDPLLIFCMTDEAAMIENTYAAGRPRLASLDDEQKLWNVIFLYWSFYAVWQQASLNVLQWDYNRDHWSYIEKGVEDYRRIRVQA